MKNKTYQERLEAGLLALGYTQDLNARTGKYDTFIPPKGGETRTFIGKAGALRVGRTVSSSVSLGDPSNQTGAYKHALELGDRRLAANGNHQGQ